MDFPPFTIISLTTSAWYVRYITDIVFNVSDPHPIASSTCESNTDWPRYSTLCMYLYFISECAYMRYLSLLGNQERFRGLQCSTDAMNEVIVKILVEVLSAPASKETKQGNFSESIVSEEICYLTYD